MDGRNGVNFDAVNATPLPADIRIGVNSATLWWLVSFRENDLSPVLGIFKLGCISEEVPEYILGEGQEENQNLGEEELEEEGPSADHEMDPNQEPEEPEEDAEEDQEEDSEIEVEIEEPEFMEPDEDEYNEYFADYFRLAPPPSPDSHWITSSCR
ncbi:hypothetical protein PIB30_097000 [Stylosanthes scabra]|uniref:Uncharacterized protein n=1 Tax=Stylosanthes scabra TaxID=79078 RepID=A0ABU6UVS8_9FABA|nr:hypothetical protein [Stylosanthes scabra]